jgi:hypothetical protein
MLKHENENKSDSDNYVHDDIENQTILKKIFSYKSRNPSYNSINALKSEKNNLPRNSIRNSIYYSPANAKLSNDINNEIQKIFLDNKLEDLKKFLARRDILNKSNIVLIYMFHVFQATGIFVTIMSVRFEIKEFIWFGISLNFLATLVNTFEHINTSISEKVYNDILAIKENMYVDETHIDKDMFSI